MFDRCKTCKHWTPPKELPEAYKYDGRGQCILIGTFSPAASLAKVYARDHRCLMTHAEFGCVHHEELVSMVIDPRLDDHNWNEAFAFAGKDRGCNTGKPETALPGSNVSTEPFGRIDVEEIIGMEEGVPDEGNWKIAGRLHDGRWFYLDAGCDYTGWG